MNPSCTWIPKNPELKVQSVTSPVMAFVTLTGALLKPEGMLSGEGPDCLIRPLCPTSKKSLFLYNRCWPRYGKKLTIQPVAVGDENDGRPFLKT